MKPWLAMLPAMLALAGAAGSVHAAEDCEALRTRIESKIAAAGVARFTVAVVDANAPASGQVVGSCELGSRKIVYERDVGAGAGSMAVSASPAPASMEEPMLTECRDGRVSMGGDCR